MLIHVWLATQLGELRTTYAQFGGPIPSITRLTISPAWIWGTPALGALATVMLIMRRPRASAPYVVLAVVLAATVVGTWYGSQLPLSDITVN